MANDKAEEMDSVTDKNEVKRPSADIIHVAKQAEQIWKKKTGKCRYETYFYKVVLGGNVKVVKQVVDYMDQNGMSDALDWLMKREDHSKTKTQETNHSCQLCFSQFFMFVLLTTVSLFITPVFYMLHIMSTTFFNRQQERISANIKLPLAFAAFSQSKDMMQYFLLQRVDIENVDSQGNNIFHYIADLSAIAAERSIEIFSSVIQYVENEITSKQLIVEQRNSAGLTAVEYAAKFGSTALLAHILKHPNLLKQTTFAVGKEEVRFHANNKENLSDANTWLELADVTRYEAGSITDQSTLLNLLSDRDVRKMTKRDLALFENTSFVGTWISLKIKQMLSGILLLHITDFILTALLLVVLNVNGLSYPVSLWKTQENLEVLLTEIQAFSHNESVIFEQDAFHRIMDQVYHDKKISYFQEILNEEKKQHIFEKASHMFSSVSVYFNESLDNWKLSDFTVPAWTVDLLYESAIALGELSDDKHSLLVIHSLPRIVQEFTKQITSNHTTLIVKTVDITNRNQIYDQMNDFYDKFVITDGGMVLRPSLTLTFQKFVGLLCVDKKHFSTKDINKAIRDPPPSDLFQTSCDYKMLFSMAHDGCSMVTVQYVYNKLDEGSHIFTSSYVFTLLLSNVATYVASCVYILIDMIERTVFMYTCVAHQKSAWSMLITVLGRKVPGSYARKQINVLTYLGVIIFPLLNLFAEALYKAFKISSDEVFILSRYILIICLVLRFVNHIHSMRLMPGIGHFVNTTFMMGTNLIHFSAVFGAVLFIFSILFHVLIDEPKCPIVKYAGFGSIVNSIFSTFKLTFGHGELSAFYVSTPVKMTYTLYVIIVGLLLMNLLIAIMSSTATEIMADPWKEALWRMEWLDEATSVEFTFCVLSLLYRRTCTCGYFSHKSAGFLVKRVDNEHRIYIEVFHCPVLEEQ